jgi:hypothetical protein
MTIWFGGVRKECRSDIGKVFGVSRVVSKLE